MSDLIVIQLGQKCASMRSGHQETSLIPRPAKIIGGKGKDHADIFGNGAKRAYLIISARGFAFGVFQISAIMLTDTVFGGLLYDTTVTTAKCLGRCLRRLAFCACGNSALALTSRRVLPQ